MTNDGVDPEHGFQQEQTTNPLRACIVFFVRWNPFKKLLTYSKFLFLIVWRRPVFITVWSSCFKVMASKTRRSCSVSPFLWELMWGLTAWTKTGKMLTAGDSKIGPLTFITWHRQSIDEIVVTGNGGQLLVLHDGTRKTWWKEKIQELIITS